MAEGTSKRTIWPTECPFAEVGCTTLLWNCQDYNQHLAQNIQIHLQLVMDLHKEREILSPLQKLNAIRSEIEYLEGTLESLGVRELPALECIKTHMKQPGAVISSLGDKCSFRLAGYTKLKESAQKWCSPVLSLRGQHQIRLVVQPNGTGRGSGTHLSVALVSPCSEENKWPIVLPRHLGIKVELLIETDGSVPDDGDSTTSDSSQSLAELCTHSFSWRPRPVNTSTSQRVPPQIEDKEIQRRVSRILPPWCQPPSTDLNSPYPNQTTTKVQNSSDNICTNDVESVPSQNKRTGLVDEVRLDEGILLFSDENFATQNQVEDFIREFNSLVFQISICLMQTQKTEV